MSAKKTKNRNPVNGKIIRYSVIKVRLSPTPEQAELLEKTFGCCRYLWNQMLSDVQEFYAATDIHYIPTPARYKKSAPFLKEVDSQALCAVHQSLRKAFLDFFRSPKWFHYPRFKTKKEKKDSFTVYCRPYHAGPSIYLTKDGIQMPKLGTLRANMYRKPEPDWELKYVTVTKTGTGKYFCSIVFKYEQEKPKPTPLSLEKTLGINHSLSHFYTDSEGNTMDLPNFLEESKKKLSKLHRGLSRMQKGSQNYEEQSRKIRLLHEHIANQRRDFAHKESRRLADAWDAVCVRDIDLIKLSQRIRGTNIMEAGFGMFREYLKYKLLQQGKPYIVIDAYAPTAKTCHACGYVHEGLKRHERTWVCPHCGAPVSRETNAAQNIRDWGFQQFREKRSETGVFDAVS